MWCFDTVGWEAGRASGLQKTERWSAGVVICLERSADLHMAQLVPLPLTVSCFSKIQIGFTFLVLAHQGSPKQSTIKRLCVCVKCGAKLRNLDQTRFLLLCFNAFSYFLMCGWLQACVLYVY